MGRRNRAVAVAAPFEGAGKPSVGRHLMRNAVVLVWSAIEFAAVEPTAGGPGGRGGGACVHAGPETRRMAGRKACDACGVLSWVGKLDMQIESDLVMVTIAMARVEPAAGGPGGRGGGACAHAGPETQLVAGRQAYNAGGVLSRVGKLDMQIESDLVRVTIAWQRDESISAESEGSLGMSQLCYH